MDRFSNHKHTSPQNQTKNKCYFGKHTDLIDAIVCHSNLILQEYKKEYLDHLKQGNSAFSGIFLSAVSL
jgi:hypothetical protein